LDELLELNDRLLGVQTLGAALRAVHDPVAPVQPHGVVQELEPFFGELIPTVNNPPVSLLKHLRTIVVLGVPPVTGAGGRAALAQDALVQPVQKLPFLRRLQILRGVLRLHLLPLQPGLDGFVLGVEVGQVGNQILQHIGVRQRLDLDLLHIGFNVLQALQPVLPVDVHLAGPADSLPATPPELQR